MESRELQELMDRETYLSAQQAVEYGFVDRVMFSENAQAMYNGFGMLPNEAIDKLRNMIKDPDQKNPDFLISQKQAATRLRLLNLKGEYSNDKD